MTIKSKHEQEAWNRLDRSLGGVIWSHCDMCKAFVFGVVCGTLALSLVFIIL